MVTQQSKVITADNPIGLGRGLKMKLSNGEYALLHNGHDHGVSSMIVLLTADTALRLSRYFGKPAKFWLGLQNDFDIEAEIAAKGATLNPSKCVSFRGSTGQCR